MKKQVWNKKVASSRGSGWKKKLVSGRLDAQINPTVIKKGRVKLNLSQSEAAKKVKLTNSTYGGIERGLRPASESNAKAIAKLVGTPVKKLFKVTDKNKFFALK